jgi:hypothetical protein
MIIKMEEYYIFDPCKLGKIFIIFSRGQSTHIEYTLHSSFAYVKEKIRSKKGGVL